MIKTFIVILVIQTSGIVVGEFEGTPQVTCCDELAVVKSEVSAMRIELHNQQVRLVESFDEFSKLNAKYDELSAAYTVVVKKEKYCAKALENSIAHVGELMEKLSELMQKLKLASRPGFFYYFGVVCSIYIVMYLIYLISPFVWFMAKKTVNAMLWIGAFILIAPRRLWSSIRAHVGEYREVSENIPLLNVTTPPHNPNNEPGFIQEALIPNAPLCNSPVYHGCIFKIFKQDSVMSDQLVYSGLGFWCDAGDCDNETSGYFMTAGHVVPDEGNVVLKNANNTSKTYTMAANQWTRLESYDVILFKPPQSITTTLGIKKAKVPIRRMVNMAVTYAYGKNKYSQGPLKPLEEASLTLRYDASTEGGFSGSPYISGNTAYGIHLGSTSSTGMGFDLGFLNMKLRHEHRAATRMRNEDSDSWLTSEIRKALKFGRKLNFSRYGLDDVVLDVAGQDVFIDAHEFDRIYKDVVEAFEEVDEPNQFNKEETLGYMKRQGKNKYVQESYADAPTLPKNVHSPTPVLVVGDTPVTSAQSQSNPKLRKLSNSIQNQQNTPGQISTAAPSSEALDATLKSILNQLTALQSQQMKSEKQLNKLSAALYKKSGSSPQAAAPKA